MAGAPTRHDGLRFVLEHDSSWVRWRYLASPQRCYSVLAARVAGRPAGHLASWMEEEQGRRFAFVAELVADGPEIERRLIDAAVARFAAAAAVAVATLASPGTGLYRAWRRHGFLFSWGQFCVHWLPLRPDPPLAQLRDPRAWEMAGGDYDVI